MITRLFAQSSSYIHVFIIYTCIIMDYGNMFYYDLIEPLLHPIFTLFRRSCISVATIQVNNRVSLTLFVTVSLVGMTSRIFLTWLPGLFWAKSEAAWSKHLATTTGGYWRLLVPRAGNDTEVASSSSASCRQCVTSFLSI